MKKHHPRHANETSILLNKHQLTSTFFNLTKGGKNENQEVRSQAAQKRVETDTNIIRKPERISGTPQWSRLERHRAKQLGICPHNTTQQKGTHQQDAPLRTRKKGQ